MNNRKELLKLWTEKMSLRSFILPPAPLIIYKTTVCTLTEVLALRYIDMHPGISAIEIAAKTGKSRSAISQILKKLAAKKVIEFKENPDNPKKRNIYVTGLGKEFCLIHRKKDNMILEKIFHYLESRYTPEETALITDAISGILKLPFTDEI